MAHLQGQALIFTVLFLWGCATSEVLPVDDHSTGPVEKAKAEFLPHTNGVDLAELRALFKQPGAPALESLEKCDFDYQIERRLSATKEQLFVTFPQYIASNLSKYHWCFYFKLLGLREKSIEGEQALRQTEFLADVARIMQTDWNDARYLQLARSAYQEVSTWEYFTSVKPLPAPAEEE